MSKKRSYTKKVKEAKMETIPMPKVAPLITEIEAHIKVSEPELPKPKVREVCINCEFQTDEGCRCPYGNYGDNIKNPQEEGCFKFYPKKEGLNKTKVED